MDLLKHLYSEASTLVLLLGGSWLAFSLIVACMAFKDENGAGVRNGLLMAVGAALVTAGGAYLKTLTGTP